MTSRFMRSCAAALLALAATNPIAHAGNAAGCPIESGSESQYLSLSEPFVRAAGARTMLYQVLSLVAVNIGDFEVELTFEGPLVGATEERHAELMDSVTREFGLSVAPDAGRGPASAR